MNTWNTLQGSGRLETVGLGTCAGMSVYAPDRRQGWLGHFDIRTPDASEFGPMLADVQAPGADLTRLEVWVGGVTLTEPGLEAITPEVMQPVRDAVTAVAQDLVADEQRLRTDWLERPGSVEYSLDVATGEQVVEALYD